VSRPSYDIAIVGFGPVGQVAANLFGLLGHRVAVFEVATSIYNLPRAAHFDGEIMRVFQSIGLADAVLPATCEVKGMDMVTAKGERLFGFDATGARTPSGWSAGYMFYQPDLEAALQEGVKRFPDVRVFAGHEVTSFSQDGAGVTIDVQPLDGAALFTVSARYLIGCDGARSVTRRLLGIELEDLQFDQPWLVVDTFLKRPVDLPDVAQQICEPSRPATFVPSAGNHRRWEFMLMPGDTPEDMQRPERIWELLGSWVGPDDAEIIRSAVYSFHAVLARRWQHERVFVAGDAAHQMPPFLGQGMCAGIRDIANLAWKLDLVMRGIASDAILGSYQTERAPHVRTIIERAVHLGNLIQTTDPGVAKRRDEMFLAAGGASFKAADDDGPMSIRPPGIPRGLVGECIDKRFGQMFPQGPVRLADGSDVLLDEILGRGFAVVAGADAAAAIPTEAFASLESVSPAFVAIRQPGDRSASGGWTDAIDPGGVVTSWLKPGEMAIVRPDRYTYGVEGNQRDGIALADGLARQLAGEVAIA
jgi:3-(3-hydroxy-phenyl)propionate hydroxylase